MESTSALADFACDTVDLPDSVVAQTTRLLTDAIACALAGPAGGQAAQVRHWTRGLGGGSAATVIGEGGGSTTQATLMNSYLITAVNACDIYRPAFAHITPSVVPPALTIAEVHHISGKELLAALVVGMETSTRLGLAIDYATFKDRGWQASGVIGPVGAATAVARLLRLDRRGHQMATGLAVSQSAGTLSDWGTPGNKFHQFRSALSGLLAGTLAAEGYEAGTEALTDSRGGLLTVYTDGGRPEALTDGLGERWELLQIALRRWPTASAVQGMVTALFDALADRSFGTDDVEHATIWLSEDTFGLHGSVSEPSGKFQALQSAHYIAAAVIHDQTLWLDQFDDQHLADPRLRDFMAERLTVQSDPELDEAGSRVEIRLRDGSVIETTALVALGDPQRPLTDDDVRAKLTSAAGDVLPSGTVEAVADSIAHLEELTDVADLMRMLQPH